MIDLHPGQSDVYKDIFVDQAHRFGVVCCTRGWGKSYMAAVSAVTAVWELMALPADVPNKVVYIIAPTYDQVTDIYYPLIQYDLGIEHHAIKSSRDKGRFYFANNVELRLLSYEAVERMRGKGAYLVVWDEVSSCLKGISAADAWESVIYPCISTRWSPERAAAVGANSPGRALIISTPKGFNFFYDLSTMPENDSDWAFWHYDYTQSPFLSKTEIEKIKQNMDPIRFASEYLALFKESGNSVFYCFDRKIHAVMLPDFHKPEPYGGGGEDVHLCIDFNVNLQCTTAVAIRADQVHILEEFQGHPDTDTLAKALKARFKGHRLFAYPDPSGKARKTSATVGVTDFSILESYGIRVLARNKAPPLVDSANCVNRLLMNAAGQARMFVHPRCRHTIHSLERTKWADKNPDTATIDKTAGDEHFSDGLRYFAEYRFPVRNGQKVTAKGASF